MDELFETLLGVFPGNDFPGNKNSIPDVRNYSRLGKLTSSARSLNSFLRPAKSSAPGDRTPPPPGPETAKANQLQVTGF